MKKSSVGFTCKDWGSAYKVSAREISVHNVYRKITGRKSLPEGKQYWTLAGLHSNDNCELPHSLRCGIIASPGQFHGVDRELEIVDHNRAIYAEAHWYHGDFCHIIEVAERFNPGLINFDMVSMVKGACSHVSRALYILVKRDVSGVVLCANFLLNNPRERSDVCYSPTDFWKPFYQNSLGRILRKAMDHGWRVYPDVYLYDGADEKSNSLLETVYLYRP